MFATSIEAIGSIFIFLLSFVIHENAHARAAYYLGDSTAKDMGRFSLNPLKHLSLIGTLLPIVLYLIHAPMISFAKPVMYNPNAFKRPKRDMILVGLVGPFSNLILATIGFLLYNRLTMFPEVVLLYFNKLFLAIFIVNLVLCAFNLIPIPPLDGSIIYMNIFITKKPEIAREITDYGVGILLFLVIVLPLVGKFYGKDYNMISLYIEGIINIFYSILTPFAAK